MDKETSDQLQTSMHKLEELSQIVFLRHIQKDLPVETTRNFSRKDCEKIHHVCALEDLNVNELVSLRIDAKFSAFQKTGIVITGIVRFRIHQTCVVSLEPMIHTFKEPLELFYLPQHKLQTWFDNHPDLEDHLADENPPELLTETFDLLRIATDIMILGINPYPRKFKVDKININAGPPDVAPLTNETSKPLAGLASLREKLKNNTTG